MLTLNDLVRWRAELHPDLVALVDDRGDRATYGELHSRAHANARRWRARGIDTDDVVALLDTNSVAKVVNMFGLSLLGAVPALLNWRLTARENATLFELIEPVAVVAGTALLDRLPDNLPPIRIALGGAPAGWKPDAQASDGTKGRQSTFAPRMPSDVFALCFSSGTTGRPKGIPMRHDSLVRSTLVDGLEIAGMHVGAMHLAVAPTFHLAGLSTVLQGLARGAEINLRTSFDPDAILDDIERLHIEFMTVVPAMFRALVRAAAQRSRTPGTSSMREITYGASPIPPELVREVQALFPRTRLRQFYGMTEIAGALTALTPDDHDPASPHRGSAGRVNPGFEVKLVDPDGCEVADGTPGQIMIRGQSVMAGYWRDPVATAEVFHDGWFASGDIALRRDGYLTIMDRAKDMIVSGGENVYPAEVEAAIYEHADVVDVAVIGVPDKTFGEGVHAVVVLRPGASLDLEPLQAFCRTRLAGYKLPRSIEIVDALPRNATGKILKRDLRAPHWVGHDLRV